VVHVRPFARKGYRVIMEELGDAGVSSKSEGGIDIHKRILISRRTLRARIPESILKVSDEMA
jgi:hypothetical protein